MRVTELDTFDSIARVGKTLARQVRRQLLIRAIEAAIALADQDSMVADILGIARRAVET